MQPKSDRRCFSQRKLCCYAPYRRSQLMARADSKLCVQFLMGTNMLTGHTDRHWKAVRKGVAPAFSAQHMRCAPTDMPFSYTFLETKILGPVGKYQTSASDLAIPDEAGWQRTSSLHGAGASSTVHLCSCAPQVGTAQRHRMLRLTGAIHGGTGPPEGYGCGRAAAARVHGCHRLSPAVPSISDSGASCITVHLRDCRTPQNLWACAATQKGLKD